MGEAKKIVVLGGGYGGVLTAKKLAKKLKKENVEIKLIDKKPYHTLLTELHEVAANRAPEDSIRIDLKKIFAGRDVEVVLDEISEMDLKNNKIVSENSTYEYDYLVVGAGSKPTTFGVEGVDTHAHMLWSFDDAVNLKEHILNMFRLAQCEVNPEKRRKLLTFVVVGGGFTGIEMIGELGEWKDQLCKDFYIDKSEVNLYVVDFLPKILSMYPDKLIKKAEKRLAKLGVKILTGTCITKLEKDKAYFGDKGAIDTNTVIWAAGIEGAEVVGTADTKQEGRKRIVTNDKLESLDYKNVYAVGDNIFYIPEGEEKPVPQMVENAEHSSGTVAHNIAADITGKDKKSYKPAFHGSMVCIGGRYGLAHLGMPGKFFALPSFFAMLVKHFINVIYFIQVAGFNKCWTYIIHEFFHVKNNRSFLGGHFAKSSPNFWLVPLRIFVGWKWLEEGLHKLPSILEDPSNIFLIPAKVLDATSAASEVVEGGAEAYGAALPVPEFIQSIMEWSLNTFFYTADGGFTLLAQIFQTGMVLGEIVFGTLLIVGLFTAVASIGTVVMGMMIWTSGMAPFEMLWYMSGGVALIGGSGSTFGLDYYVLPELKGMWKEIGFVKKWYLYVD